MKITLQTALITGSSRGLGRAIAVKLAQVRDAAAVAVLVQGDTADAGRAAEVVEEAAEKMGGCHFSSGTSVASVCS